MDSLKGWYNPLTHPTTVNQQVPVQEMYKSLSTNDRGENLITRTHKKAKWALK